MYEDCCPDCHDRVGDALSGYEGNGKCEHCRGTGILPGFTGLDEGECGYCDGTGTCQTCGGTGTND